MTGGSSSIDWQDSECDTDPPLDGSRYLLGLQRSLKASCNNNGGVIQVTKVPEVGQYLLVPDLRSTDDPNKSAIVSIDGIETEIFGSATKATWETHAIPFIASMTNVQIHIDNPDDHPGFSGPTGGPLVRLPASPFVAAEFIRDPVRDAECDAVRVLVSVEAHLEGFEERFEVPHRVDRLRDESVMVVVVCRRGQAVAGQTRPTRTKRYLR